MRRLALVALLAGAAPAGAWAGEAALSTPTLEARLDDAAPLAAIPALRAFLDAENASLLEERRMIAEEDAEAARKAGAAFRPHRLEARVEPRFVSARFASVLRSISTEAGGDRAELFLDPLTWDARTGDFVRLDAFLAPGKKARMGLIAISGALRDALLARPGASEEAVRSATVPDVAVLRNFTLEPSDIDGLIGGMAFHFAPRGVLPGAAGAQRVVLAQAALAPYLRADMARLFGGAPRR